MRKLIMLAVLAIGTLAFPAAASAAPFEDCPPGTPAGPAVVYTDGGATADDIVGVCIDNQGYIEIGSGANDGGAPTPESYVVVQGYNDEGYIGVSNYEEGTPNSGGDSNEDNRCQSSNPDGTEGGAGTNSGGCYGTNETFIDLRGGNLVTVGDPVTGAPIISAGPQVDLSNLVPLPVCGDNTGPFDVSSRDGCRADTEDATQLPDLPPVQ